VPEWSLYAADDHLAAKAEAADGTLQLGHDNPAGTNDRYPLTPFWLTINPDNPADREEVLVTALSVAGVATCTRGYLQSPMVAPPPAAKAHKQGTPVRLGTRAGAYPEFWHEVGAAGEPPFLNSWVQQGGVATVAFMRTPEGLVLLRGGVVSGTAALAAFNLPVGYRPGDANSLQFACPSGAAAMTQVNVGVSGNVLPQASPGGGVRLDDIRFMAEL
jgi:hypothetical protein